MTNYEILQEIDQQSMKCTPWEVEFLESCLRRGPEYRLSAKQLAILHKMAEKYLAASIVDEWLGQMRLV